MFRKNFKIKSNVLARSSEKKHLFAAISNYYKLDTTVLSNLFHKSQLRKIKIECHNNDCTTIYQFDDKPLFFEVHSILVPTVYCLWLIFDFVMSFTIHEETLRYLMNGSDLMIPGIIVKLTNDKSYGIFAKNEIVSINTKNNRAPVAIGLTNYDNYDMLMCGGKGKAVNIIHVQGDYLWAFGDKSIPPQIDWDLPEKVENNSEIPINQTITELEILSIDPEDQSESEELDCSKESRPDCHNVPEKTIDEMLLDCFLHAIKCELKDKDLPIILNLFYANFVLKFCPDNYELNIKKTSYKKFSNFMKEMEKEGIIILSNVGKGIQAIKSVTRNHEKLRFTPTLTYKEISKEENPNSYCFPKIEEVHFVTEKSCNILKFEGFKKSDTITPSQMREIVTNYVKRNELQSINKDTVQLDDVLKSSCLNANECISQLSWKTLFDRLFRNMTPGIVMVFDGKEVVHYKNMKTPKIKLEAINKNNKMVTRIDGVEIFRINVKQLCTTIQQTIGCSCGMVTNKSGESAVQAQGDQRKRIVNILKETFNVPNNLIEIKDSPKSK